MQSKNNILLKFSLFLYFSFFLFQAQAADEFVIKHQDSGKCLEPLRNGWNKMEQRQLIFRKHCKPTGKNVFVTLPNGLIQHVRSKQCLRPGNRSSQRRRAQVFLSPDCENPVFSFSLTKQESIQHNRSELCLHPRRGKHNPHRNTRVVLKQDCTQSWTKFSYLFLDPDDDQDRDGLMNSEDRCPVSQGPTWTAGCPGKFNDTDGDGVLNPVDQCPLSKHVEGSIYNDGCSLFDREDDDIDGRFNGKDLCPDSPIFISTNESGCELDEQILDNDGDGIPNGADLCPETFGNVNLSGCSKFPDQLDNDNDGVLDDIDQCPYSPRFARWLFDLIDPSTGCFDKTLLDFFGSSIKDDDGDNVSSAYDLCADTSVLFATNVNGCAASQLDSDNDTVNDAQDLCVSTEEGITVNNTGCVTFADPQVLNELSSDGSFGQGQEGFVTLFGNNASGSVLFDLGEANVVIDSIADEATRREREVQLTHLVNLVKGDQYTLCFDAKVDKDKSIFSELEHSSLAFRTIRNTFRQFFLKKGKRTYKTSFLIDRSFENAQLKFLLSNDNTNVQLDNIGLYVGEECGNPIGTNL